MSFRYSSDIIIHSPDIPININSCGELRLSRDSHIIRPCGRKDYQLIYICEGCCYVTIEGETAVAVGGDVILYRPDESQDYLLSGSDKTHTYWIHFGGGGCRELFEKLQINNINIIKSVNSRDVEYLISALCKHFNLKTNNYPVICSGMLTSVLALISNQLLKTDNPYGANANLISELISRLKLFHNLEISVAECARLCRLSQSHFTRIFKEITGEAPQQYIIKIRIDRAKELISFTDKNISEIAEATGFKDQNYFARIFKKNVGMTPTEYRKKK